MAETLVNWCRENGVKEVVSLAGVGTMETAGRIFGATTNDGLLERLPETVQVFDEGNISGISGSIMVKSSLAGMDGICLLGETQVFAPDPRAAASVIEVLNEMYGTDVDTQELMEQADQIESQMRQLAEQTKRAHEEGEAEAPTPIMYG